MYLVEYKTVVMDKINKSYSDMTTKELMALAENGDPEAQFQLAGHFKKGIGVRKSFSKAVEWYTKAAKQGNVMAQYNLAECYKLGRGVKNDIEKAVEWYTKAAEQGDQEAKERLLSLS